MDFEFLICAFVALFLFWVNSFQWSGFRQTFHLSNNLHKHHQYGHLLSHKPLPRKRLIHCPEWHLGNAEPLSQSDTANMRPSGVAICNQLVESDHPLYIQMPGLADLPFGDVKYSSSKNWVISLQFV